MIVEERDGGRRGLVNLAQILHAWIVGRHLLDQQIGIAEDDRKEILELVLELVLVAHRITRLSRHWCEPSATGIRCASASMVDTLSNPTRGWRCYGEPWEGSPSMATSSSTRC